MKSGGVYREAVAERSWSCLWRPSLLLLLLRSVSAVHLRQRESAPSCWSAEELQSWAAKIESSLEVNYRFLAPSRKQVVQVVAKGLLRELHNCTGGEVVAPTAQAAAASPCGQLAKGIAAPLRDNGACDKQAEERTTAAAQLSVTHLESKREADGWRHEAYMPMDNPAGTLDSWRVANPISPMHDDEPPVHMDKHASFH
eukprot:TRINITY_DN13840_c0_g1_i1.p1 TRINITY_DN13840_c0_g1~~TRINITY_DN13840_c0_g1_i1.p1  ORF type:complete len:199 (-),score=47.12 TRINITY_DN13840_c0_g1_i1:130-726(-)